MTQKKRIIVLLSIPQVEALALPIVVEQTTLEYNPCLQGLHGIDIITPGTSTVDHIRDNNYEFARFDSSQTQRRKRL